MEDKPHFWRLGHLSDRQLLERLQGVLRTQRGALAELIAHLGEVEERRLHLAAAHGSLFSYCVQHLGMSEDEACRRIEVARLARKFPILFGALASGRLSLSVALLLKPVLTADNHAGLIAAVGGASLRTARELLAVRFPSPDVPSRIRKLPGRLEARALPPAADDIGHALPAAAELGVIGQPRDIADAIPANASDIAQAISAGAGDVADAIPANASDIAQAISAGAGDVADAIPAAAGSVAPVRGATPGAITGTTTASALIASSQSSRSAESELDSRAGIRAHGVLHAPLTPAPSSHAPAQAVMSRYADPRPHQRIDPLSAERYRIVFTGDADLKQKLELARDLLRHSHPSGDLALIVSRGLDLLLQELSQRRFGARRQDAPPLAARAAFHAAKGAAAQAEAPSETLQPSKPPVAVPAPAPTRPPSTAFVTAAPVTAPPVAAPPVAVAPAAAPPVAAPPVAAPPVAAPPVTRLQSSSLPAAVPGPAPTRPVAPAIVIAPPTAAPPVATRPSAAPATSVARAARRAVLARDGLGCCWVDARGNRCGSTAWLELDHHHPSGKGGSSAPENLRLLCRAHNRFAAERAYGRDHVERAIQVRQRNAKRRAQTGQPPATVPA